MDEPQTAAAAPDLCAIVYVSKAARLMTEGDLLHIQESSRKRNKEHGITGVLLYADGSFMQYLEGPAAGLLQVYAIIKTSPLHYGLIDLVRERITVREFGDWWMACHHVGAAAGSPLGDHYPQLAARLASALPGTTASTSVASQLLSNFWSGGRSSIAPALQSHQKTRAGQTVPMDTDAAPRY